MLKFHIYVLSIYQLISININIRNLVCHINIFLTLIGEFLVLKSSFL